MSTYDLIIRNGMIVDGSGGEPLVGDVGVTDGLIVKIGSIDGAADTEIDANGKVVTPGFVDIHTHYDGQAIWSERLIPSSQHGAPQSCSAIAGWASRHVAPPIMPCS